MTHLFIILTQLILTNFSESPMQTTEIPRPEYPCPQFERSEWINLNGKWTFTLDPGKSGGQRGFQQSTGFDREIIVPFCPESKLSGVAHTDFIEMMWYQRTLDIPQNWAGKQIWLRFGAVDFECEVFIDGKSAGRHWGGTSSFGINISQFAGPGQHNLVVYVRDELRSGVQPGGKQCPNFFSAGCHYTRTTGIWQTVWLEAVSPFGLENCQIVPDFDQQRFLFTPRFYSVKQGLLFQVQLFEGKTKIAEVKIPAVNGIPAEIKVKKPKTWSPGNPFLYDLKFSVLDASGQVVDEVHSYAGFRKIHVEGDQVFLNNHPVYLRLVLDQGFYPDGIWTAPSDAALKKDIELSQQAGFNGARLHQKVFEERFHYWADKLGYLTWGESSSWGLTLDDPVSQRNFLSEWREIVVRDRNHPSIIAWTPFNETNFRGDVRLHKRFHLDAYELTRDLDATRPVNDASGYVHVKTDLWTVHNYEQDPVKLKAQLEIQPEKGVFRNVPDHEIPYGQQPYLVDEFGGIKWIPRAELTFAQNSWGYGEGPKTEEEFYQRLEGMVQALLDLKHVRGYCYTQLTDVEQEQNGIYLYDRSTKFDMKRIHAIFSREPK